MDAAAHETERTMLDMVHATWHAGPTAGRAGRYIVAEHVNNGAGHGFGRTLDAVVLDTWPSKGLLLHGIEVKVSASDLRRELQDTRKFAEFSPYLDHFSIAAPKGVATLSLLPPAWGLYCPDGKGGLRAVRKPLMLHSDGQRESVDRSLFAAFCRAVLSRSTSAAALAEAEAAGYAKGERVGSLAVAEAERERDAIREALDEFEAASGVGVRAYAGKRIGEAVALVLSSKTRIGPHRTAQMRAAAAELEAMADGLDGLDAALRDGV